MKILSVFSRHSESFFFLLNKYCHRKKLILFLFFFSAVLLCFCCCCYSRLNWEILLTKGMQDSKFQASFYFTSLTLTRQTISLLYSELYLYQHIWIFAVKREHRALRPNISSSAKSLATKNIFKMGAGEQH